MCTSWPPSFWPIFSRKTSIHNLSSLALMSTMIARSPALAVFIKNPIPGKVKTRLAAAVGDDKALEIYAMLTAHTREVSAALPHTKFVFYDHHLPDRDEWPEGQFQKKLQMGSHLGERMYNALMVARGEGAGAVAVIGSDCIELTAAILKWGFHKLQSYDTVVGPARDGGYYFLGFRGIIPKELFQDISWSTGRVLAETMTKMSVLGLSSYLLPELGDIDTVNDWQDYKHNK